MQTQNGLHSSQSLIVPVVRYASQHLPDCLSRAAPPARQRAKLLSEPHVSVSWSGICGYGYACASACWPDPISPTVSISCSTRWQHALTCHKAVGLNRNGAGGQASLVRCGCSVPDLLVCRLHRQWGHQEMFHQSSSICVQQISLAKNLEGIN